MAWKKKSCRTTFSKMHFTFLVAVVETTPQVVLTYHQGSCCVAKVSHTSNI